MTEKTLAIDAEALLEAFQRDEVRIVHGEADGGEVGLATDAQLNERIAELTAQLASARSDIESATLNWRNTARTAWERNGKLEKQLKEAEREREIERAWADQFYGLAQKLQQTLDAVLEKKSAAEADAGRLRSAIQKLLDAHARARKAEDAVDRDPENGDLEEFEDAFCLSDYLRERSAGTSSCRTERRGGREVSDEMTEAVLRVENHNTRFREVNPNGKYPLCVPIPGKLPLLCERCGEDAIYDRPCPAVPKERRWGPDCAPIAALSGEQEGETKPTFDLIQHLHRQRVFSRATFGPGNRAAGVVNHIRKELAEIEAEPHDLKEWIDVAILAFDGAWRTGAEPEEIALAIEAKQTVNEGREWPDWRTADPNKAIEHVRPAER